MTNDLPTGTIELSFAPGATVVIRVQAAPPPALVRRAPPPERGSWRRLPEGLVAHARHPGLVALGVLAGVAAVVAVSPGPAATEARASGLVVWEAFAAPPVAPAPSGPTCVAASPAFADAIRELVIQPFSEKRQLGAPVRLGRWEPVTAKAQSVVVLSDLSCEPCLGEVPEVAFLGKMQRTAGVVTLLTGGLENHRIDALQFHRWAPAIHAVGGSFAFVSAEAQKALEAAIERETSRGLDFPTTLLLDAEGGEHLICSGALIQKNPIEKEVARWLERVTPPLVNPAGAR